MKLGGLLAFVFAACATSSGGGPGGGDAGAGVSFDDAGCKGTCSDDLRSATDCHGDSETCGDTQQCDPAGGACVDACQAAVDSKSSVGCEYYPTLLDPQHWDTSVPHELCFVAVVANTWTTDAHVSLDFGGKSLPPLGAYARIPAGKGQSITYEPYPGAVPPGKTALLFLAGEQQPAQPAGWTGGCPIPSAVGSDSSLSATGIGHSFHLKTDVPVVVYQINPYGGGGAATTGASLLLPVSAWDTNYVAMTAGAYSSVSPMAHPGIDIIAAQNGTVVTLLPSVALTGGGGIPSSAANTPVSFNLDAGEQANLEQAADLTGSILQTNKPVAVMAKHSCMNVPSSLGACDHGEQTIPPVSALASEYAAVMYLPRTSEPAIWRIVGAVDGTALSFSSSIPAGFGYPAPPATLQRGEIAEFATAEPFVVASQDAAHPFLALQTFEWVPLEIRG